MAGFVAVDAGPYIEGAGGQSIVDFVERNRSHATLDGFVEAAMRFGKGRHRAKLNFGDCFSYALAKASGLPLLFKGDDFTQTDIESALG